MIIVDAAWIFDVDGVITDPQEKKVKYPQTLDNIADKIKNGEPVALNTGRSLSWLIDRVLNPLLEKIENKKVLENFFAVGEKGGTWLTFNHQEEMQQYKDHSIFMPQFLQQQIRDLVETKFSQSMFYDSGKETMISTEMHDKYPIERYRKDQTQLKEYLIQLLEKNNLSSKFKIDPTTISIDIENKRVGKGFALERILKWLKAQKINPRQFIAFGDSRHDIEMAEKLYQENLPFEFVFVGNKDVFEGKEYPFPITYTQNRFDEGTLEYLRDHSR